MQYKRLDANCFNAHSLDSFVRHQIVTECMREVDGEWCRQNGIDNVYIWPDGETPKRIYEEGGYRVVEIRKAGRAVLGE